VLGDEHGRLPHGSIIPELEAAGQPGRQEIFMDHADQADHGFTFRRTKDGQVFIRREGRIVVTLRGDAARGFLSEIEGASIIEQQQTMARVTGNYKRGNERRAADHPRNRAWAERRRTEDA
jgi:hypothetical protein